MLHSSHLGIMRKQASKAAISSPLQPGHLIPRIPRASSNSTIRVSSSPGTSNHQEHGNQETLARSNERRWA